MKAYLLPCLLLLFGVSSLVSAQSSSEKTDTRDSSAVAILSRAFQSMGCAALTPSSTSTLSGRMKFGSEDSATYPITISSQGNRRWRVELDTPRGHRTTVFRDGRGQTRKADGPVEVLSPENTVHELPTHIPCLTHLQTQPQNLELRYVGTQQGQNALLDVLHISPKQIPNGAHADRVSVAFWVDRSTGYLAKLQYTNTAENADSTALIDIEYSDYRLVEGIAIPFHQRLLEEGKPLYELSVENVNLNTTPADFELR